MTESNISTNKLSNSERLNEASILLYRALAINDLLFEASVRECELSKNTLAGSADALNSLLKQAKDLIDGASHAN